MNHVVITIAAVLFSLPDDQMERASPQQPDEPAAASTVQENYGLRDDDVEMLERMRPKVERVIRKGDAIVIQREPAAEESVIVEQQLTGSGTFTKTVQTTVNVPLLTFPAVPLILAIVALGLFFLGFYLLRRRRRHPERV